MGAALRVPLHHGKLAHRIPRARANRGILRYWLSKRVKPLFPSRADIMPEEIVPFLPHAMVIAVESNPLRFRFRVVGTYLVSVYGRDFTGKYLDQLDLDDHHRAITCDYVEAAECGVARCDEYSYVMHSDRYRHFERLLLPLATDGRNVDVLFGSLHEYTFTPNREGLALSA